MKKTALVLGATGLVGEMCVQVLLSSPEYDKVIALVRRPLALQDKKLQNLVVNFDKLQQEQQNIKADDVFCCMGTTIGKAGSQEAFRRVDFEIPKAVAEIALNNGAKQFLLCSSLGADANSTIFYSKVKGELEDAISHMKYEASLIFRPSILLGDRKEQRTGEAIGRFMAEKLSFLFAGPLKKYAGTPVNILAQKMVKAANSGIKGIKIYENEEIIGE